MKRFGLGTYALSGCVAVALLAGCGGSQLPTGAPGAMPQTSALAMHADRGKSWMLPEAKSEDLLYVSNLQNVKVYSYPAVFTDLSASALTIALATFSSRTRTPSSSTNTVATNGFRR
jgi:hypothetical protein